eukprot:366085-Chlamydomonas_euryale.AAC.7
MCGKHSVKQVSAHAWAQVRPWPSINGVRLQITSSPPIRSFAGVILHVYRYASTWHVPHAGTYTCCMQHRMQSHGCIVLHNSCSSAQDVHV